MQGALAAGQESPPKPPGGTGSGKPLDGGSFTFGAPTRLALKAESQNSTGASSESRESEAIT